MHQGRVCGGCSSQTLADPHRLACRPLMFAMSRFAMLQKLPLPSKQNSMCFSLGLVASQAQMVEERDVAKAASGTTFKAKSQQLSCRLEKTLGPNGSEISSLNRYRHCFSHRHGVGSSMRAACREPSPEHRNGSLRRCQPYVCPLVCFSTLRPPSFCVFFLAYS